MTKGVANAIGDNNIGLQDLVLSLASETFEEKLESISLSLKISRTVKALLKGINASFSARLYD